MSERENEFPNAPWVVMHDAGVKCLHCDAYEPAKTPARVDAFLLRLRAFAVDHEHCEPRPVAPKDGA